jgi:putative sterol carrier protein
VAKYPFLSDDWIAEARRIRAEYHGKGSPIAQVIKMNQVITEVPFGEGTINSHMDTSSGEMELETGHIDGADLKVTLDYATAKAILVDANPQAAMQAFMAGKIKVDGDLAKLMAMQATPADPTAVDIAKRIQDITE